MIDNSLLLVRICSIFGHYGDESNLFRGYIPKCLLDFRHSRFLLLNVTDFSEHKILLILQFKLISGEEQSTTMGVLRSLLLFFPIHLTILFLNVFQVFSLLLLPFSKSLYFKFNGFVGATMWIMYLDILERRDKIKVVFSGMYPLTTREFVSIVDL